MKISVICPVRNEEHSIRTLLDSLKQQSLMPDEVIIADGGSTDRTVEIIESYDHGPLKIQVIRGGPGLPGRGRNRGTCHAVNEWVAYIDAGVKPADEWLQSLAAGAETSDRPDVVYGSYEPVTDTLFKECAAMAYVPPSVMVHGELIRTRSTASVLLRRHVWEAVGGFPEDLRSAEDLVFMNKVDAKEFRIGYAPGAVVSWNIEPTLWRTFKRFITYSHHNIRAGLWRYWQAKILQRYVFLLLLMIPAFLVGWRWLAVPAGLWLLMLLARAIVAISRNQKSYPGTWARNVVRVVIVSSVLAAIDLAAILGCLKWLLTDHSFTADTGSVNDGAAG